LQNYANDGGPLNPKESDSEKKMDSIEVLKWPIIVGNNGFTSKEDSTI
jgi:hypothetical protein